MARTLNGYRYCPCDGELPDPCPACGATVAGNDRVHGVCQLTDVPPTDYGIRIVLVHRDTGEII